jgi:hypothetical protein
MPPKSKLIEIGAGVSWGAHFFCLILLYRVLIGSVLEYWSVCFTNMTKTHMLGVERVQYRELRITLGLMGSTPNNCLGVLCGIPPLAEKFAYLNFRYFVAAFYRLGHSFRERLGVLGTLNIGRCIEGYSDVLSLEIVPSESLTLHKPALLGTPFVDGHMEKKTCQCSGGNTFISAAPRAIDCDVQIWCVVHFLYGLFFD